MTRTIRQGVKSGIRVLAYELHGKIRTIYGVHKVLNGIDCIDNGVEICAVFPESIDVVYDYIK